MGRSARLTGEDSAGTHSMPRPSARLLSDESVVSQHRDGDRVRDGLQRCRARAAEAWVGTGFENQDRGGSPVCQAGQVLYS